MPLYGVVSSGVSGAYGRVVSISSRFETYSAAATPASAVCVAFISCRTEEKNP